MLYEYLKKHTFKKGDKVRLMYVWDSEGTIVWVDTYVMKSGPKVTYLLASNYQYSTELLNNPRTADRLIPFDREDFDALEMIAIRELKGRNIGVVDGKIIHMPNDKYINRSEV